MTASRAIWKSIEPVSRQKVPFAIHSWNGDFVLIRTAASAPLQRKPRLVAALENGLTAPIRSFIGPHVVTAVLIDRQLEARDQDQVAQMVVALDQDA